MKTISTGPDIIILRCIGIGACTGAICGAIFGIGCVLATGDNPFHGDNLWYPLSLALPYGLVIGLVVGAAFGLPNGVVLAALLMFALRRRPIQPRALRNACGITCMATSVVGPMVMHPKIIASLATMGWLGVAIIGAIAAIAWFASGRFCRWYLSNAVSES